jgi:hypothetical protein
MARTPPAPVVWEWSSRRAAGALAANEALVSDGISSPIASPIRKRAVAATNNGRRAPEGPPAPGLRESALWPLNPAIRKLSPGTTAPRACRQMAARRHPGSDRLPMFPDHGTQKMVRRRWPTLRNPIDAGAFRPPRIPIRKQAVAATDNALRAPGTGDGRLGVAGCILTGAWNAKIETLDKVVVFSRDQRSSLERGGAE